MGMLLTSSPKSIFNIRSASSITRYFTERSEKPLVFSRWSTRRPGVAMTTWGFLASARACVIMSMPPTITAKK